MPGIHRTASFRGLKQHGRTVLAAAQDFVFPPACVYCAKPLAGSRRAGKPTGTRHICGTCRLALAGQGGPACLRCGAPVGPNVRIDAGCIHCRDDRFAFAAVAALGVYAGPLKSACLAAKESGGGALMAALGELLWERHRELISGWNAECILPVPHHWMTRLWTGQLPPVVLAHRLGRRLKVPVAGHILRKVRRTPAQSSLPPSGRRANLRDAFRLASGMRIAGARVLLTDDILTTGTTTHRIARLLRQAGAAEVNVAVIARGLGSRGSAPATPATEPQQW
ncbi:DNA utilization protein GntX [Maioricimonas rarisocia]|uniref:DNA utilization protein GntX n=1 Tax=Maioricimonas rarisocia TaxID=2528026 RepID=A0A517Z0C6_9PLAN|nr:phosphoribosyltransferase family protein [Maioricimonas rarisocia]QDU35905.1 DNA utilization protein GntX [Maioricimonas rarisocia]